MSLDSDEGESEQNEMRILQTQLENTNSLVKTLSSQLRELKDQVSLVVLPPWLHPQQLPTSPVFLPGCPLQSTSIQNYLRHRSAP